MYFTCSRQDAPGFDRQLFQSYEKKRDCTFFFWWQNQIDRCGRKSLNDFGGIGRNLRIRVWSSWSVRTWCRLKLLCSTASQEFPATPGHGLYRGKWRAQHIISFRLEPLLCAFQWGSSIHMWLKYVWSAWFRRPRWKRANSLDNNLVKRYCRSVRRRKHLLGHQGQRSFQTETSWIDGGRKEIQGQQKSWALRNSQLIAKPDQERGREWWTSLLGRCWQVRFLFA